jgi:hypothetical protein
MALGECHRAAARGLGGLRGLGAAGQLARVRGQAFGLLTCYKGMWATDVLQSVNGLCGLVDNWGQVLGGAWKIRHCDNNWHSIVSQCDGYCRIIGIGVTTYNCLSLCFL